MSGSTSVGRLWRLAQKELREILRDRRTIITLVLMPILVYPLLGLTFQKFLVSQLSTQQAIEFHVAFATARDALMFRELFSVGNRLLGKERPDGSPVPSPPGEPPEPSLHFLFPEQGDQVTPVSALVSDGTADLAITFEPRSEDLPTRPAEPPGGNRSTPTNRPSEEASPQSRLTLITRKDSPLGEQAQRFLEERLRAVNEAWTAEVLSEVAPGQTVPVAWKNERLVNDQPAGYSLATLVPLVLILMTVTGAVYPAIDLTAGERERGTLEPLIAAPVPRTQVLLAKYVAVMAVALLTAAANLLAMVATAYSTGLEAMLFGKAGLSVLLVVRMAGLLALFAGFFSAVMLTLTSVARSFKEAQAYLIPLMLVSLAPGILALMPGLTMTRGLALVPLVNMVLLTRDLFDGTASASLAFMTIAATLGYAAVALLLAARLFGTDAVLYGSSGSWQDLWQRPATRSETPSWSLGLVSLTVLFPLFVLLGGIPGRLQDVSLIERLAVSASITAALFALWPCLLAIWQRVALRSAIRWQPAGWSTYIMAAVWGLTLWPWVYEMEISLLSQARIDELVKLFESLETDLQAVPLWVKLLALAVVPAVCEELFFRGWLFAACRTVCSPWVTIALTSVLFGLFHVLVRDALLFERFLPTALMGIALGCVAWKSGSVRPGMLLHVLHNGWLLSLPHWSGQLTWLLGNAALDRREHLPSSLLIGSAVCIAITGWGLSRLRAPIAPQPDA
jgi:sodium transport system permease protein